MTCKFDEIAGSMPMKEPCFLIYHTNDDYAFVMVSPPETNIKGRMLFAATRAQVLLQYEQLVGSKISKKVRSANLV